MLEAYRIARENVKCHQTEVKGTTTAKSEPQCCNHVLIRNMTPRGGTDKLRNHWEDNFHTVLRQV